MITPQPTDLFGIGSLAVVHKVVHMPNQSLFVFAEGLERVKVGEYTQLTPFMRATVETIPDPPSPKGAEIEALQRNVLTLFQQIVAGSPTLSDELSTVAGNIDDAGRMVHFIASSLLSLSTRDKQDVLETRLVAEPGQHLLHLLMHYQRQWTVGVDYTFAVGNGLYAATEYFRSDNPHEPLASSEGRGFSALSLNYPVGVVDQVSAMFYRDWNNHEWYRLMTWQRTYDDWVFYLIGFWDPKNIRLYNNQAGANPFAGTGLQIMAVFNH